ncbi:cutinase family protein [Pseudonocardiaceae bacterium YIM PH 21723]|nr:cutinase family protein [Pseudonocardiaceae bacterium YIM PH 21723]
MKCHDHSGQLLRSVHRKTDHQRGPGHFGQLLQPGRGTGGAARAQHRRQGHHRDRRPDQGPPGLGHRRTQRRPAGTRARRNSASAVRRVGQATHGDDRRCHRGQRRLQPDRHRVGAAYPLRSLTVALHIIAARGSTEPQSGSFILEPIGRKLIAAFPDARLTQLAYPATLQFDSSVPAGVTALLSVLNSSAPDEDLVLLGFSQGAWVIGETLALPSGRMYGADAEALDSGAADRIRSVVFFGDPRFTEGEPFNAGTFEPGRQAELARPLGTLRAYESRLRNYCAKDDLACQGPGGNMFAHVSYASNEMPDQAVEFILNSLRD